MRRVLRWVLGTIGLIAALALMAAVITAAALCGGHHNPLC